MFVLNDILLKKSITSPFIVHNKLCKYTISFLILNNKNLIPMMEEQLSNSNNAFPFSSRKKNYVLFFKLLGRVYNNSRNKITTSTSATVSQQTSCMMI